MPPREYTVQGKKQYFSGEEGLAEKNLKASLAGQSPSVAPQDVGKGVGTFEPTVLTNATIKEDVIPDLNSRLDTMVNKGSYMAPDGTERYADGTLVPPKEEKQTMSSPSFAAADNSDKEFDNMLEKMKTSLDANTQRQLSSIQNQFAVRRQQQADINMRLEQGVEQSLLLGGSARYAPISSSGTYAEQEKFGIRAIAELDALEQVAINSALAARDEGNFKIMEKQLERAEKRREEKAKLTEKLAEQVAAENKKIRDKQAQASRDLAISSLLQQGITDPNEIMSLLNEASMASGYGQSDFTAEELDKTLKALSVSGSAEKLPQDIQSFEWLRKNKLIPAEVLKLPEDQQYFAYLNLSKLADSGKLASFTNLLGGEGKKEVGGNIGVGANSAVEEQIIRMRLFGKLSNILNKGQVSNEDATRINANIDQLRAAGMSEQEIMSSLAGFPSDVKTPYNSTFISSIASNTDTADKQQQLMGKVSQLMANGDYVAAMKVVENTGMANARKIDPDNYVGTSAAQSYAKKINEINKLVESYWPATIGPVSGTFQEILGKLKSKQAQELKSKVTALVADMRNDLSGTAVTDSEKKFLDPLIPDLSDRKTNFNVKLNALLNNVLTQHNSTRSLANLPEVEMAQLLKDSDRLKLYESAGASLGNTVYNNAEDFLGAPIPGGAETYDPSVWNNAP